MYCCSNSLTCSRVSSTSVHLSSGNDHVVLAEGNAGLERLAEAQRHDLVAEDDALLLTAVAVDGVDDLLTSFLVRSG
jgi:hypothetical protein